MFGSALLKFSEHERPLCLMGALAIVLLVFVSVTVAHATTHLVNGIGRDLAALRLQLEQIEPWQDEVGRRSVAFNADLGDGSPAFRRLSLVTIMRAANRRLERLIEGYYLAGDDQRARTAEGLRLVMYDLQHQIDRLARTADPATAVVLRQQVEVLLGRSERALDVLLKGPDTPLPSPPRAAAAGPATATDIDAVEPAAPPFVLRGGAATSR